MSYEPTLEERRRLAKEGEQSIKDAPSAYEDRWHEPISLYMGFPSNPLETSSFWNKYLFENSAYLKRRVDELEARITILEDKVRGAR